MSRPPIGVTPLRAAVWTWLTALALGTAALGLGCSRDRPARAPDGARGAAQQAIVDSAAQAFERLRNQPRFAEMDAVLARAHGVMIFPRLVKASLIFGGEGGNGVLVARGPDGSWSDPAFYSVGAPSVGLQVGYQEATVVLFIMDQPTLERALRASLTLGTASGASVGRIGEHGEAEREAISKNVYQVVETGGAFAGVSLEGYVIGVRDRHNAAYYGAEVGPRAIVIERAVRRLEADVLRRALAARAGTPPPSGTSNPPPPVASPPATPGATAGASDLRECSPESRQVQACTMIFEPVCAEVDTGVRCVRAPCPEARTTRTFDSACRACVDPKTHGYRPGACSAK